MSSNQSHRDPSSFRRHASLYFDDGNIALSALENGEEQTVVFRVHRGVLAVNSEVFSDMFKLPAPPEHEMYDGVPIAHVPDTAEELESLLQCLYDPTKLTHAVDPASSFWRGLMHMATKYSIDPVRSIIIEKLEKMWPTTLSAWDDLEGRKRLLFEQCLLRLRDTHFLDIDQCYDSQIPEPAAAIRFARDFDVPTILPSAFYDLSLIPPTRDWSTCRRHTKSFDLIWDGGRSARWPLLDHTDLMCLMKGRDGIGFPAFDLISGNIRFGEYTNCKSPRICSPVRSSFAIHGHLNSGILRVLWDILDCDNSRMDMLGLNKLCSHCLDDVQDFVRETRQELWDGLSRHFSLSE